MILYQFDNDINLVNTLGMVSGRAGTRNFGGTTRGFIPDGEDGYLHIKAFDADGGVQWWPSRDELFKVDR